MKDLVRYDVKGSGLLCHRIIKDECKAIVFDDFSIQNRRTNKIEMVENFDIKARSELRSWLCKTK